MELIKPPFMVYPWSPDKSGLGEDALVRVFHKLKEQGLYEIIFHENPEMSLSQYVNFFSRPNVLVQLCLVTDESGAAIDIAGLAYLSDFDQLPTHRRAAGSFVFFKEYQMPMWTSGFVPLMFDYWFSRDGLAIDLLIGMTPKLNRAALLFCKRIGLKYVCELEGYTAYRGQRCAACLAVMNRQDYEARYCPSGLSLT